MFVKSALLPLLLGACAAPPADPGVAQADGASAAAPADPEAEPAPERLWAGAGSVDFTFSDYREEQGFTDCEVHYTLRWVDAAEVPCEGCTLSGAVSVQVADDACEWQDWAAELEPRHQHYAVHADTETLLYFDGEHLTDMRELGWELTWEDQAVHLVGMSTDHTYYAVEARTLTWGR